MSRWTSPGMLRAAAMFALFRRMAARDWLVYGRRDWDEEPKEASRVPTMQER